MRFRGVNRRDAGEAQNGHGGPDGPAVALRAGHAAERVGESGAEREHHHDLHEIGERRGIFEWMRAIGVEEAAAVGAENLDGFLRSDGALGDHLIGDGLRTGLAARVRAGNRLRIDKLRGVVGPEILDHALRDKHEGDDQARREKDPEHAAGGIDPKIADGLGLFPRDAADDGNGQGDAHRGGSEVVICEAGHLREVAHGRFPAVVLPVGVGGE